MHCVWTIPKPPPEQYREDYRFWLTLCSEISCRLCEQQELPTADLRRQVGSDPRPVLFPDGSRPEVEPALTDQPLPTGFDWKPEKELTWTEKPP